MRDFDHHDINLRIVLLVVLIPCVLICMILSLKYLAPLSILANVFILVVVLSCVSFGIKNRIEYPDTETKPIKSFGGVMKFIGVCIFSMEGVGVTLPIENSMARPTLMPRVIIIGMTIVCSLVILSGFFGYWGFGENPAEPITNAFPKNWYTIALKIAMILMIWITFALNFWVPFNLVWVYLKKRHTKRLALWERIYRAIFIIVITSIAIAFPSVTALMGVIGAVCLSNMGFIYPAFIELMLDWETPGLGYLKWRLWKFAAISLFGLFIMFLSAYFNGRDLIRVAISK
ncbi:proton-coupled amino acid transporter-like protein pathetic [Hyposmocoma kahamanoa]|uniref:proton-coupled amino acid transporter-like protein pathetic n=1 Tax=Hyposmocoma kahamanoa TaxID=1477025 RepID=UPI000E6D6349|nr:proton-coupled amino acid transporter-like protein pathetic [Hyposmocoma kahamanoa]